MDKLKEFTKDQLVVKVFDKRESMGKRAAKDVGDRIIKLLKKKRR